MLSPLKIGILVLLSLAVPVQLFAQPVAENGVLDLRDIDLPDVGPLQVKGEWAFYWEKLIDPINPVEEPGIYVDVPSAWSQLQDEIPGISSKGYGTYRLRILVGDGVQSMAVRFTEVFSASGYYINGRNIGFNGLPGTNKYQSVFGYRPEIYVFPVKDTVLDLVVHVSNFEHRSGGIRGSFQLGTPMQVMSQSAERQYKDFFLLGAFLIIGIYFMGLYLMRSELYKLFFALICLMMAFRVLILSETDLFDGDWVTGISLLRLEYLSFDLLVPLFVLMIRFVFPNDFPKTLFRIIIWICSVMVFAVIISPVSLFTNLLTYYMYFVIFTAGVILYVIIIAWNRGRSFAKGFAIGIGIVTIGAVNDMLFISDVIETGLISHYTMFIYLIIYAMIFSGKTNQDVMRNERLSREIKSVNDNLEDLVMQRTEELNMKSEQLMKHQEELRKSNLDLQREVAIRNKFFTIMGHDIRGPVGYSKQMLELLLSEPYAEKEKEEMLKLLANSSRAILNLVENMIFWGRSQTGELRRMATIFTLDKVVQEAIELFNLPLKDKQIKVSTEVPVGAKVFADKEQVKLILRNLIGNAIKFTPTKGSVMIAVIAGEDRANTIITVRDTGVGMQPEKVASLFTDVATISTSGTKNEKGSGFGLILCRELTELNGGTITAESEAGKGSIFRVVLPAANE